MLIGMIAVAWMQMKEQFLAPTRLMLWLRKKAQRLLQNEKFYLIFQMGGSIFFFEKWELIWETWTPDFWGENVSLARSLFFRFFLKKSQTWVKLDSVKSWNPYEFWTKRRAIYQFFALDYCMLCNFHAFSFNNARNFPRFSKESVK